MSKIFWAEHKETGERWRPEPGENQYLVLYDSGYAAVVTGDFHTYISPLGGKWRVVYSDNFKNKLLGPQPNALSSSD